MIFLSLIFFCFPGILSQDGVYRQKITLENSGGFNVGSPSQVSILVDTKSLILDGKLDSSCYGLAFVIHTTNEKYTFSPVKEISWFLEGGCNYDSTSIWLDFSGVISSYQSTVDVYMYYGNHPFPSNKIYWNGYFDIWKHNIDDRFNCPSGYEEISNNNYYIKGHSSIHGSLVTAGSHRHYMTSYSYDWGNKDGSQSYWTGTTSSPIGYTNSEIPISGARCHIGSHKHTFFDYTEYSTNNVPRFSLLVCRKNTLDMHQFLLAIFDNDFDFSDNHFSEFSDMNSKFPMGYSYSGYYTTTSTHSHSLSDFFIGMPVPQTSSTRNVFTSAGRTFAAPYHNHRVDAYTYTNSAYPKYKNAIFGRSQSWPTDLFPVSGMIIGISKAPPLGWTKYSAFDGYYVRAYSYTGSTGGSDEHYHYFYSSSIWDTDTSEQSDSSTLVEISSPISSSYPCISMSHTHTLNGVYTEKTSNQLNHRTYMFYKRDSCTVTYTFGSEENPPVLVCDPECSSHGTCSDAEEDDYSTYCECSPAWNGTICDDPLCPEDLCVLNQGYCDSPTTCICYCNEDDSSACYFGDDCSKWECYGFGMNNTNACSGSDHGECSGPNKCNCSENWGGDQCEKWKCGGIVFDDDDVCNGRGNCTEINTCQCDENYEGDNCESWRCFGLLNLDNNSCTGSNGMCIAPDTCNCTSDVFYGDECQLWDCRTAERYENGTLTGEINWYSNNDSKACSGNGTCIDYDLCSCPDYQDELCSMWNCFRIPWYELGTCGGEDAFCVGPNNCLCPEGYYGPECRQWDCFGIQKNITETVCSGHGTCVSPNQCVCNIDYVSNNCQHWNCFGPAYNGSSDDPLTCGNGTCVSPHRCNCPEENDGEQCEYWFCYNIRNDKSQSCGENGTCVGKDMCVCDEGMVMGVSNGVSICVPINNYALEITLSAVGTGVFVMVCMIILLAVLIFLIFAWITKKKSKKQVEKHIEKMQQFAPMDIDLQNTEYDEDKFLKLKMQTKTYEVSTDDVVLKKQIGTGGSGCKVFLGLWNDNDVAIKLWPTFNYMYNTENGFDDFEQEVRLMSQLSHPYILKFFGCLLKPPKIGILMEYCMYGNLVDYVTNYVETGNKENEFSLEQKFEICRQCASALDYIHNRNMVHRDVKSENVLIVKDKSVRVIDFGISRVIDRNSRMTRHKGTSVYMAPEVTMGLNCSPKLDVFSLSILYFELLHDNFFPYGRELGEQPIEFKVANNPNFRPVFKSVDYPENEIKWFKDLIKLMWNAEQDVRPTMKEIVSIIKSRGLIEPKTKKQLVIEEKMEEKTTVKNVAKPAVPQKYTRPFAHRVTIPPKNLRQENKNFRKTFNSKKDFETPKKRVIEM